MELEVRIARALEELEEIYHLRWLIYSSVGYIKKEDYPEEKEKDEYDALSTHFYVYSKSENKVVGAMRLIHDSGKGFPIEKLYNLSFLRNKHRALVEISRRVIIPNRVKANYKLLQAACQFSVLKHITCMIFSVNPKDIDFYNKVGCIKFGEEKFYDEVSMPALGMYIETDRFNFPYNKKFFELSKDIILDI